ncbi:outer membrane beta-barrel protein [Amylibacter sp. SFDW26]|uniref:outer membrane beta-barrel protein n=1 Tax=Amylibacter sp. SFDW26 TaxID=2652722 RepID=UPI0012627517|nr:outer membrane beta-barrel protein [Amylibacter sp. SFDW26]KAB7610419.1 outer membrane beta-barrel protein [Amylibacter sp. SFDW26]
MKKKIISTVLCAALLSATPVYAADGFYFGGGASLTKSRAGVEQLAGILSSKDDFVSGVLLGGYRKQLGNNFWATEVQLEFPSSSFENNFFGPSIGCSPATGPFVCELDTVLRLRGVYGGEISEGLELYGTAGLVYVTGDAATSPTTVDSFSSFGFSFGFGLQKELVQSWKLRGEVNYDSATNNLSEGTGGLNPPGCCGHDVEQMSLQVSIIKAF